MLLQMRSYRMGLIQTPDQLRFSYLAIIQGAQAILNGIGLNSLQVGFLIVTKKMIYGFKNFFKHVRICYFPLFLNCSS